jgi:cobalamin biosynthesis protein CobD/CbiB
MAKLAEAEVWVRRSRQVIHNQPLIQLLGVLAIIVPLPLAMSLFWFAFSSAAAIQSLVGLWAVATMTYVTLEMRNAIQDRASRLQQ